MNLLENILEGLRSVKANMLRSMITAAIVTIGITALISVSTAIDAAQKSVGESLSALGSNTFDITSRTNRGGTNQGVTQKVYPPLMLSEAMRSDAEDLPHQRQHERRNRHQNRRKAHHLDVVGVQRGEGVFAVRFAHGG